MQQAMSPEECKPVPGIAMENEECRGPRQGQAFQRFLPPLVALFPVILATGLIVGTYSAFYQTYDEGAHLACGMEWLDHHTYILEPLHPPLARVATAIFPYL